MRPSKRTIAALTPLLLALAVGAAKADPLADFKARVKRELEAALARGSAAQAPPQATEPSPAVPPPGPARSAQASQHGSRIAGPDERRIPPARTDPYAVTETEEGTIDHTGAAQFQPDDLTLLHLLGFREKQVPSAPVHDDGEHGKVFSARYRTVDGTKVGISGARMIRCRYVDQGNHQSRRFVLWQGRRPAVSPRAAASLPRPDATDFGWWALDVAVDQCPANLRDLVALAAQGDPDQYLAQRQQALHAKYKADQEQRAQEAKAADERKAEELRYRRAHNLGPTAEEILPLVMTALRDDRGWETVQPNRAIFRHAYATAHLEFGIERVRCTSEGAKNYRCRFELSKTWDGNFILNGVVSHESYDEKFRWTSNGELQSSTLSDTMTARAKEDSERMSDHLRRVREQAQSREEECRKERKLKRLLGIPEYVPCN